MSVLRSVCVPAFLVLGACQLPLGRAGPVVLPESVPPSTSTSADIAALEQATIDAVNRTRARQDARALRRNDAMMQAAREHARELANRHELDHASKQQGRETFAQRLAAAGAPNWTLAGENLIQLPFTSRDIADEAVAGWLGSASHRAQMLEPSYTDTGVGIVRDDHGDWFIVQLFIRRR